MKFRSHQWTLGNIVQYTKKWTSALEKKVRLCADLTKMWSLPQIQREDHQLQRKSKVMKYLSSLTPSNRLYANNLQKENTLEYFIK